MNTRGSFVPPAVRGHNTSDHATIWRILLLMPTPLRCAPQAPPSPPGWTDHVHFDTVSLIAGEPVVIDGHTFLVQSFDCETAGTIQPPHPVTGNDALNIVGRVRLQLEHAPWRRCPALEPEEPSALVEVPRGTLELLIRVAEYVSLGRRAVDHQPDSAPYPDAAARRALGALDEAGLLPTEGATE